MKLHRDLGVTQKTAWHLAHRVRKALQSGGFQFSAPVEVDETYIGGKRKNMSNARRQELEGTGRGARGQDGRGRCEGQGDQARRGQGRWVN